MRRFRCLSGPTVVAAIVLVAIAVLCCLDTRREPVLYAGLALAWGYLCTALLLLHQPTQSGGDERESSDYLAQQVRAKATVVFAVASVLTLVVVLVSAGF